MGDTGSNSNEDIKKNINYDKNFVFPGLVEELNKFLNEKKMFDMQIYGVDKDGEWIKIQIVNFEDVGITVNVFDFKYDIHRTRMSELNKSLQLHFEDEMNAYNNDFGKDTKKAAKVITDVFVQVYEVFEIDYHYGTENNKSQGGGCMIVFMLLSSAFLSLLFLIIS